MKDAEFDSEVAVDGGELDASKSENPANSQVLEYLRNALKAVRRADIYCGLVKNRTFNAYAFRTPSRYLIGLFSGAVRSLLCSSFTLLSHKQAFPDIGSPRKELGNEDLSDGFRNLLTFCPPRSPERMTFAQALFQFSSTFVFCHEFGHIWAGHVDHFFKEHPNAKLSETTSTPCYEDLPPKLKQAIELDADRAAVSLFTCSLLDLSHAFQDRDQAFRAWLTAMFLVYSIMAEVSGSVASYRGNTHPHPWLRMMFIIPHACHEVSQRTQQSKEALEAIAMRVVGDIQNTWTRLKISGYQLWTDSSLRKDSMLFMYYLSQELAGLANLGISRCTYPVPSPEDFPK